MHIQVKGHSRTGSRGGLPKEYSVATPEEFVKRFNGDKVINKVRAKARSLSTI